MSRDNKSPHVDRRRQHIVLSGGATGGHLFPGLAVAQQLQSSDAALRISFVGVGRPWERSVVVDAGFGYHAIHAAPAPQDVYEWPRFASAQVAGLLQARRWLQETSATLVVGLGGFSSAPAVAAAQQLGIPTVLLEQNSVPGRATRWLAPRAKLLCAGMPQARHWLAIDDDRFAVTGNPVRAEFWQSATSPPANERTLVVLGGSGGARELNAAFLTALGQLNGLIHGWRIIHQTGVADVENVARHYALLGCNATVTPFIDHPAEVLSTADVVVSRGGAITLAELAALGKCAVVCPFSRAADQHQWHNAQAYAAVSACEVVDFRTGDAAAALAKKLSILLTDRRRRGELSSAMRRLATPDATQRVTTLLQQQLTATSVNRQAA